MPVTDLPPREQIRDYERLAPFVRRMARDTWLDPDWLWRFCLGMQEAGLSTEAILAALERQHRSNRLSWAKRLFRRFHLKVIRGFWSY
jgi:hypothetical protein